MAEDSAYQMFTRNQPYAVPLPSYQTPLMGNDEVKFRDWVASHKVPFDPDDPDSDYDMRGYWNEVARDGDKPQSINPNDAKPHWPDDYKTPFHETFSKESKYALPNAPSWTDDDKLVDENGRVLFDERANAKMRESQQ